MSDTWGDIQALKNKQTSLREKLARRRKERQEAAADILANISVSASGGTPPAPPLALPTSTSTPSSEQPPGQSTCAAATVKTGVAKNLCYGGVGAGGGGGGGGGGIRGWVVEGAGRGGGIVKHHVRSGWFWLQLQNDWRLRLSHCLTLTSGSGYNYTQKLITRWRHLKQHVVDYVFVTCSVKWPFAQTKIKIPLKTVWYFALQRLTYRRHNASRWRHCLPPRNRRSRNLCGWRRPFWQTSSDICCSCSATLVWPCRLTRTRWQPLWANRCKMIYRRRQSTICCKSLQLRA